jgi:CheY-like chemotaxis protein
MNTDIASSSTPSTGPAVTAGRYLTFRLDHEIYGVPILDVREIIELQDITPVPRTPVYVRGVINLRGKVLPLVDLKLRFGLDAVEADELTVIVVLQSASGRPFGCLVDVLTLDVEMPRMDGLTFLQTLMTSHPMPVVMCSSLARRSSELVMECLRAGAVSMVPKPHHGYALP